MRVRFLQDFRGLITDETFYRSGEEVELRDEAAQEALANGWAEEVVAEAPADTGAKTGSKNK